MKTISSNFIALIILLFVCTGLQAENRSHSFFVLSKDTLKTKESRKVEKEKEKLELRHSHSRFTIKLDNVYANLDTKVIFQIDDGIFNVSLGLEDNFGLPNQKYFFTGSFSYRITPRSGIYAQYYGINRQENHVADQDYYFLDDTIRAGSSITSFFNTQVISAGYMLSILKNPDAFLGAYFNIYFMMLETGVYSNTNTIDAKVELLAPLPNFGLLAAFKLNNWLYIDGSIGFFSLHTEDFGGAIYNYDISLVFRPARWIGINLSYKKFDVNMNFVSNNINTIIDYNFRGPSLGLSFIF